MPTKQDYVKAKQYAEETHLKAGLDRRASGRAMAIGIGPKVKRDVTEENAEDCLRFYVERKISPIEAIHENLRADPNKYGVPTDVIETGRIVSFQAGPGSTIGLDFRDLDSNVDPAVAGTLGAVVGIGDDYYVLGSNHAMAVNGRALGARILFKPPDRLIVDPSNYIFARITNHVHLSHAGPNTLDCALAKIEDEFLDRVKAEFPKHIVTSAAGIEPAVDMKVTKVDESEPTTGVIKSVNAQRRFDFSFGSFDFENLVLIEGDETEWNRPFARLGDSGALVAGFDGKEYKATAIVMGGSSRKLETGQWKSYTLACSYNAALAELRKGLGGETFLPEKLGLVFELPRRRAKVGASTMAGE